MADKLPLHPMPEYNLFGLEGRSYENSKVIVLPVPYDSTVTYKTGAREGPQAIINASRNIEPYSYEVGADLSALSVYTLPALAPDMGSPEGMIASIKKEAGLIIDDGKIPLLLGGEHTITLGSLQAFKDRKKELSVLHFDAHSDTRDELFGSRYTHATVMARARELYPSLFQLGIRSIDAKLASRMDREKVLLVDEMRRLGIHEVISRVLDTTSEDIYITLDFDVLDPGEMPSVGTPEPDGLRFAEVMQIIKETAATKRLCGIDFVELCPIPYLHAPDYLAAKMIYLTLGYFLKRDMR